MAPEKRCKVIVAGGGIHGLTLANMLEQLDIDYVLLEARGHPTPALGAGIGLFSNGLRILDQLGLYDQVAAIPQAQIRLTALHDSDGSVITSVGDFAQHYTRRFAYPLFFFDRHWLLKVLYNNLKHKDRVLISKGVQQVNHVPGGVEVTTTDEKVYAGTLVVGADGVHSRVRDEMHRLAAIAHPDYFTEHDDPEKLASCSYLCSFGIAQNVPHLRNDGMILVIGKDSSHLHIPGPDKKDYFFFWTRQPKTSYGSDIKPRYSKEEEEEIFSQYGSLPVCKNVTLGNVFSNRLNSTLTPIHEYVREKWFFGRTIVLGDACHKNNPLPGQGGNNAIESAAEFINGLVKVRDSRPNGLNDLSDADIQTAFQYTQSARRGRANDTVDSAHIKQAIAATESAPVTWLARKFIAPVLADEFVLNFFSVMLPGAARLQHLPMPKRRHANPFDDEVPGRPFSRCVFIVGFITFAAIMTLFISCSALFWPQEAPPGSWIQRTFASLASSVATNKDQDLPSTVHMIYFLAQLISPLLIYTMEGHRIGHRGTFLSLPFFILAATQVWGIWTIAPIYAIFHALQSHGYCTGKFIKPEIANALVPSLVLGYVVPSTMMFISIDDTTRKVWSALWQIAPPLVPALTIAISSLIRVYKNFGSSWIGKREKEEADEYERYNDVEFPDIKNAYTFAFAIQASVHIIVLSYGLTHSKLSLSSIFFGASSLIAGNDGTSSLLKHAMIVFVLAVFLSQMYSIWILRARGYVVTKEAIKAVILTTLGQVVLGPGATWTGLWYWRESVLVGLNTK